MSPWRCRTAKACKEATHPSARADEDDGCCSLMGRLGAGAKQGCPGGVCATVRPYELPATSHQHAGHLMCKGALHGLRCVYMGRVTSSGQTSLHSTPAANAEPLLTYDTCAREDLRAHALWYLGLVVVFVVMVMALVRCGYGGQERWCTYVLYFPLESSCAY